MRIGLCDIDSHNWPNLCLMKLSAYHKARGDQLWESTSISPIFKSYLRLWQKYLKKVFQGRRPYPYRWADQ